MVDLDTRDPVAVKVHQYVVTLACGCKYVSEYLGKTDELKPGKLFDCFKQHGKRRIVKVEYRGKVQSGN